jgi:hypothetical protein
MDNIHKEHVIAGVIGGFAALAMSALACKLMRVNVVKAASAASGTTNMCSGGKIGVMTSSRIPQAIGPYASGRVIECCGARLGFSSGQLGLDPATKKFVDVEDVSAQAL